MPLATDSDLQPALVADLQAIDGTGIFTTAVAKVYETPPDPQKVLDPAIALTPGGGGQAGDGERLTIGAQPVGAGEQRYALELLVRSVDPEADARVLLRDVRNALERPTGNLITTAGVDDVIVEDWTQPLLADGTGRRWGLIECTVLVLYLYRRGAV